MKHAEVDISSIMLSVFYLFNERPAAIETSEEECWLEGFHCSGSVKL